MLQLVRRCRRWLAAIAVAVVMAGAFLMWGPIGLGNGPLWLPAGGYVYSWTEPQIEPVVYVIPIGNAGHGPAVIDSVGVDVDGSPRSAPLILRQALIGHMVGYDCTALGAFSGHTSALAGCVQPFLKGAAGAVIPVGTYPARRAARQAALVLKLAGPRPGRCWDITSVVVRYHIGIRHYVGTFGQVDVITCGVGGKVPEVT